MNKDNMWICLKCGVYDYPCNCVDENGLEKGERVYCSLCSGKMIDTNIRRPEFVSNASGRREEYMQELIQELVIPYGMYDEKEHERSLQKEAERAGAGKSTGPRIKCPYCKSINTRKVGTLSRSFSIGLFGLGSSKIGKQWHCNECGSDF